MTISLRMIKLSYFANLHKCTKDGATRSCRLFTNHFVTAAHPGGGRGYPRQKKKEKNERKNQKEKKNENKTENRKKNKKEGKERYKRDGGSQNGEGLYAMPKFML